MPDIPKKDPKEKVLESRAKAKGIRTMAEDISMLSGKEPKKKAPLEKKVFTTPNFLQRIIKRAPKKEKTSREEIEKLKKEEEKRESEERRRGETARLKESEERRREETARLKESEGRKKEEERHKREEKGRQKIEEKIRREEEERKVKEEERQKILEKRAVGKTSKEKGEKEIQREKRLKKKLEKKLKIPPPSEPVLPEKPRGFTSPLPGVLIFFLLLTIVSALTFFFLSYQLESPLPPPPDLPEAQLASLPKPPSTPTHKECRGLKCITIEGEGPDLCKGDEDCKPVLPPIALEISEELKLTSLSSDVFIPLLDKKFQKEYPPGTFIEIIPKYKGELLTISQLFKALDLHPPKEVKENLETYTLYLYSQKELFVQKRKNRLGISFRAQEGKIGTVRKAMSQWEKVLPNDFYKVHTLWKRGEKASPNFLDNRYKNIHIRYTNFPVPDLSIDWAIKKDILILTTSRESMWKTIDIIK